MATLSKAQIRQFASAAGFAGSDLDIAVAVALAESGGNTQSHNSTPPDNSYGLMQINMLGAMGPDRRRRYGLKSNEDLFDPATNMRVAHELYKSAGNSFKPWTTYTRGTYKKYMGSDAQAATETEPSSNSPASDGGIVTGGLNALGSTLMHSFSNIGGVIIGVVLIILAIVILIMQSKTGNRLVKKGVGKVL